jgi:SAM-dependent methyltransferase
MTSHACIICGNQKPQAYHAGLLRCPGCSHVFADMRLEESELFELYRRNYFFGEEYSDYLADKRVLQKNFRQRMHVLNRFLDPNRHRHLFEIGAAYGFFLELVRDRFDTVAGADVSEDAVSYARSQLGLDVVQADFLRIDLSNRPIDVVCLWDTIEHLRDPHLYIEKVAKAMRAGGLLALTTGDSGSLNARRAGAKWRLIHPPTHLHYFSLASMRRLLDRLDFELIYTGHPGFYRSVDNVAYNVLVLRRSQPNLYFTLKRLGVTRFDFYLNLFDIMYVIARKR